MAQLAMLRRLIRDLSCHCILSSMVISKQTCHAVRGSWIGNCLVGLNHRMVVIVRAVICLLISRHMVILDT
jgi:hypothetical protein